MAKRVYFAFHYKDVAEFRANVIRQHGALQSSDKSGFFDWSIWEEAKKQSTMALKRMINQELEGTSVTAVLIGSETWFRPWVRYEIFKSLERGNKLLGIHINGIKGRDGLTKVIGPNPFDFLAVKPSRNGNAECLQCDGKTWAGFSEVEPFSFNHFDLRQHPNGIKLSAFNGISVYDWVRDDGFNRFRYWIQ